MRHQKKGRKFHRKKGQRQAFFKSIINSLMVQGGIETTEAKAKEIKSRAEKLITMGKKQNLASLKFLISRLPRKSAEKIYYEIAPRYKDVSGGYLRIVKRAKPRKYDGAKLARIEFV